MSRGGVARFTAPFDGQADSVAGMRVALDGRSLTAPATRGMDRYTLGLARGLRRHGVEVSLLHRAREPLHPKHLVDLPCELVGIADRGGLAWEQYALPRALTRGRFDLYHAPAERGVPLLAPCPSVMTVHSVTTQSYCSLIQRGLLPGPLEGYVGSAQSTLAGRLAERYWRRQVFASDLILTPSRFTRDEVISLLGVDASRIRVTQLAADELFRGRPADPSTRAGTLRALGITLPYLLYVGGFERHKNVEGLLSAFAQVRRRRPDVSLVAVGTGRVPEALREQARPLGPAAVVFLSDLGSALVDLYDEAEAFVSLSWRESFCLPALEALSRGVVSLASEWGATREVAGETGSFVDPRDISGAVFAMLALLSMDRELRRDAARAAAARFSWAATIDGTLRTYRELLDPKARAAERARRGDLSCGEDVGGAG